MVLYDVRYSPESQCRVYVCWDAISQKETPSSESKSRFKERDSVAVVRMKQIVVSARAIAFSFREFDLGIYEKGKYFTDN